MPEFSTPFLGMKSAKALTDEDLIRAVRFSIAAEYEAIQFYSQLAESTHNQLAIDVLLDVSNEERVHVGEFLKLLYALAPDEAQFYANGSKETEEKIKKLKH